jgi:hypothetical protein
VIVAIVAAQSVGCLFVTPTVHDSNSTFCLSVCAASLNLTSNSLIGTLPSVIGLMTNLGEFVDELTTDVLSNHLSDWYLFM